MIKLSKYTYLSKSFTLYNLASAMKDKLDIKGMFFDLDGTILDTKEAYVEAARTAFMATGQYPPELAVALEIPKRLEQRLPFDDIVKAERHTFLDVYLNTFYTISQTKSKPIAGAIETLGLLSKKAKLSIITMRYVPKEVVMAELGYFGLSKYFTHVVTALDTLKPKPSPEALIKAVSVMGVQMSDCIIVGDSIIDVKAGEAAGVKTVAVLSGLYSHKELLKENPTYILNDLTELPDFIQ
jgi:HAD superfamily hydrolase (TIGR01509 family)